MSSDECDLCGDAAEWIDDHHVSYNPEETIRVCRSCHAEIHNTNKHPSLKPDGDELTAFYNRDNIHVDMSKVPSRDGWTTQIKYIPCSGGRCDSCPHGPYYYYYQRRGEEVRTEYGGKVTEDMLADQSTLSDYGFEFAA